MSDYNGWTNYATWRVNLEMFDGFDPRDYWQGAHEDAYDLGQTLKDYAEEIIVSNSSEGVARDYAFAFLDDVNWREIAQHMIDEHNEEAA
ncbi:MAG: hypothetical protein EB015_19245 [Methylocystaceae bacterium]|nr:hypothetical protein [Methylocystaceae bacterium]